MLKAKVIRMNLPADRRVLAVSDIHGTRTTSRPC